jgi:hypothetical protein
MIMDAMGSGNSMGSVKSSLVLGEYSLEVEMHKGCINYLNGMDLGNNARMTFFEYLFHAIGTVNGAYCDALELILLAILLELHN